MEPNDGQSYIVRMVAFACEPGRGSEPGVGFEFALALARLGQVAGARHELVTRAHRIAAIEAALSSRGLADYLEVTAIDVPRWLVRLTGRRRVRFAYIYWQWRAALYLRRRAKSGKVPNIVHHVTFATEALPTFERWVGRYAARVFGPAGSSQRLNSSLLSLRSKVFRRIRALIGWANLRDVELAVAQNDHVAADWAGSGASAMVVRPNIVLSSETMEQVRSVACQKIGAASVPRTLVSVGLLVSRKRHETAIEALSLIHDTQTDLAIIGGGPLRAELEQYAKSLGVTEHVHFLGSLTRFQTLKQIASAAVLVHASRQEGAGWVVGEAQALGTHPVVFYGSGSDTVVRMGGVGTIIDGASADVLADGIRAALGADPACSERWFESRLDRDMNCWYEAVRGAAELKLQRTQRRHGRS